jgi:hypothetical protein
VSASHQGLLDLDRNAQGNGSTQEDRMSAELLNSTRRELLAATAAAGEIGLLAGTQPAAAMNESIRPSRVEFPESATPIEDLIVGCLAFTTLATVCVIALLTIQAIAG